MDVSTKLKLMIVFALKLLTNQIAVNFSEIESHLGKLLTVDQ